MIEVTEKLTIHAPKKSIYDTLSDYHSYPEYMLGVDKIKVRKKLDKLHSLVVYQVSMFGKDVSYTLKMTQNPTSGVSWELFESEYLSINSGSWKLKLLSKHKTDVTYRLAFELSFPVPRFILRRHVHHQVDELLEGFKAYCESHNKRSLA